MFSRFSFTCLFLISAFIVSNAGAAMDQLRLNRLSVEQGLSQNSVSDLMLDSQGYLWLATNSGLNRYDGNTIEQIKGPDNIFGGHQILSLFQDSNQKIWVSNLDKGLYTLDLTTKDYQLILANKTINKTKDINAVWHMVEQANGDIWLAAHQNLRRYRPGSKETEIIFTLSELNHPPGKIRRLLLYKKYLFMGTTQGLYVLDIASQDVKSVPLTKSSASFSNQDLLVRDDKLWIATEQGLYSVNIQDVQGYFEQPARPLLPEQQITNLNISRLSPDGENFYLSTTEGLFSYVLDTEQAHKLWSYSDVAKHDSSDDRIDELIADQQGNLWLTSRIDGAFYWDKKTTAFTNLYHKGQGNKQLNDNWAWSVTQTKDDTLWVGTSQGLNKVDLSSGQVSDVTAGLKDSEAQRDIYNIMPGENGVLWLSTGGLEQNVVPFDSNSGKVKPLKLANDQVKQVMAERSWGHHLDSQGMLWFVTEQHFYRYDTRQGSIKQLKGLDKAFIASNWTSFLGALPGHDNAMLLYVAGKLWLYDSETDQARNIYAVADYEMQDYTSADSWAIDRHNVLWISMLGHGLVGLDATTFEQKYLFDASNKLNNNEIYAAQLDNSGMLWISSNHGLMRLNVDTHHVTHFTNKNGLASNEFNGGAGTGSFARLKDGRLAFASMLGVTLFDPLALKSAKEVSHEVKFTEISLLSRNLDLPQWDLSGSKLRLNHDDIGLKIAFSTMKFTGQGQTRFRYQLGGAKQIKYPETTEPYLIIPQLPPGHYIFSVVAIDPQTGIESPAKSIDIRVAHTWWASPLAYIFYALLIMVLAYCWWRRVSRQQHSLSQAHNEIIASQVQAKRFGEAFAQTRDWVVILDMSLQPLAVNQSFTKTFGEMPTGTAPGYSKKLLGLSNEKIAFYKEIVSSLKPGEHWHGEDTVLNTLGQSYPVLLSINLVLENSAQETFIVVVITDISAQKAAENKLRQMANYDVLTGLPNRALLLDRIKHAITHARRHNEKMALLFIDLDRFKQVNDSLGHDVGDQLLIAVTNNLTRAVREADTVARLGGDEFVLLIESYHSIENIVHIAHKIINQINQPVRLGEHLVSVSASIGISLYPEDAQQHSDLLKSADVAMYHAKQAGKNNFKFFTAKMDQQARHKLDKENKIKQAFANNQFVNFYQPIVDAHTLQVKGFELLLRWPSDQGMITPNNFIPVAEDIGLIVKMTQRAIKQGLLDLAKWHKSAPNTYLSINLSIKDLEHASFTDNIETLIKESQIPAPLIRFEITESALMVDIEKCMAAMQCLDQLGVSLALDDFGTGYSSLKYLKDFPVSVIKIDRSFVKDIGIDANDEAIIDSIIGMAANLNMSCIAEGVETREQLMFLQSRNCAQIQGFLFSQAVPMTQTFALLDKAFKLPAIETVS